MALDAFGYSSERALRTVVAATIGVLVARYLGPADLGLLSYVSTVFALLSTVTLLGMQPIVVRDVSITPHRHNILSSALLTQLPVAVLTSFIGAAYILGTRGDDSRALLLVIVMAPLPVLNLHGTYRSYLEASGKVARIVSAGVGATIIGGLLKVLALLRDAPLWVFGGIATVEAALVAILYIGRIPGPKHLRAMRRTFSHVTARRLLSASWPLLVGAVAVSIYMQADIIMLGALVGDEAAGVYTAAVRLSEVWYIFPVSVAAAVRPRLARLFAGSKSTRYDELTQQLMSGLSLVALLAVAVVLLLGDTIIAFLYGTAYAAAGPVLSFHILAAPFVFLGVASSHWFIDRDLTRMLMIRTSIGAALNVALNSVLIPIGGARGAAAATLVSYASVIFLNGFTKSTQSLFGMQMRALALRRLPWPRKP